MKVILPKSLTTITTFSKIIAGIMFVTLPLVGFKMGMEYQRLYDQEMLLQKNELMEQAQESTNTTAPVIEDIVGNGIYVNQTHGFQFEFPEGWYVEKYFPNDEMIPENLNIRVLKEGTEFDPQETTIEEGGFIHISLSGNEVGNAQDWRTCSGTYPQTEPNRDNIVYKTCRESEINGLHIYYDELVNNAYQDFQASRVSVSEEGKIKYSIQIRYNQESKKEVLDYYNDFIESFKTFD